MNHPRGMQDHSSLVSERQIIQVHAVRILLVIAVHLVIDGHPIPVGRRRTGGEGPVEITSDSIQRDRLIQQFVV